MAAGIPNDKEFPELLTVAERDIMHKRREYIKNYKPPKWKSSQPDPVSGDLLEVPMTSRASIQNTNEYMYIPRVLSSGGGGAGGSFPKKLFSFPQNFELSPCALL